MPGIVKNHNNKQPQYRYEVEILGDGTTKDGVTLDNIAIVSIKKFDSYNKEVGEQYFNLKSRDDKIPTYTYMNSKIEGIGERSQKEMLIVLDTALNQKNVQVSVTTLDIKNNAVVVEDPTKLSSKEQMKIARNFVESATGVEQAQANPAKVAINIDVKEIDIKGLNLGAFASSDKLNNKYKTLSGTYVEPTEHKEKGNLFEKVTKNLADFFHRSERSNNNDDVQNASASVSKTSNKR